MTRNGRSATGKPAVTTPPASTSTGLNHEWMAAPGRAIATAVSLVRELGGRPYTRLTDETRSRPASQPSSAPSAADHALPADTSGSRSRNRISAPQDSKKTHVAKAAAPRQLLIE
jgi:hypothetical protein